LAAALGRVSLGTVCRYASLNGDIQRGSGYYSISRARAAADQHNESSKISALIPKYSMPEPWASFIKEAKAELKRPKHYEILLKKAQEYQIRFRAEVLKDFTPEMAEATQHRFTANNAHLISALRGQPEDVDYARFIIKAFVTQTITDIQEHFERIERAKKEEAIRKVLPFDQVLHSRDGLRRNRRKKSKIEIKRLQKDRADRSRIANGLAPINSRRTTEAIMINQQ